MSSFVNNETSLLWWRCEMKIAQRHRKWKSKNGSQSSSLSRWLRFGSIICVSRGSFLSRIMVFCRSQQGRWDFPMSHSAANLLVLLRPLVLGFSKNRCSVPVRVFAVMGRGRGWSVFRLRPPCLCGTFIGKSHINIVYLIVLVKRVWGFFSALLAAHLEPRSVCAETD